MAPYRSSSPTFSIELVASSPPQPHPQHPQHPPTTAATFTPLPTEERNFSYPDFLSSREHLQSRRREFFGHFSASPESPTNSNPSDTDSLVNFKVEDFEPVKLEGRPQFPKTEAHEREELKEAATARKWNDGVEAGMHRIQLHHLGSVAANARGAFSSEECHRVVDLMAVWAMDPQLWFTKVEPDDFELLEKIAFHSGLCSTQRHARNQETKRRRIERERRLTKQRMAEKEMMELQEAFEEAYEVESEESADDWTDDEMAEGEDGK